MSIGQRLKQKYLEEVRRKENRKLNKIKNFKSIIEKWVIETLGSILEEHAFVGYFMFDEKWLNDIGIDIDGSGIIGKEIVMDISDLGDTKIINIVSDIIQAHDISTQLSSIPKLHNMKLYWW